jgi:hypothetical protein
MGNYIHNQMEWNVCVIVLLSIFCCLTIYNISLRGLRKIARRRACPLGRAWRCFRYIDYSLNIEHECTLLIFPSKMTSMSIFPYITISWAIYKALSTFPRFLDTIGGSQLQKVSKLIRRKLFINYMSSKSPNPILGDMP